MNLSKKKFWTNYNINFLPNNFRLPSSTPPGILTFLKGICSKVCVIVRLEFKLTYYNVCHYSHYAWGNLPYKNWIVPEFTKAAFSYWHPLEKA